MKTKIDNNEINISVKQYTREAQLNFSKQGGQELGSTQTTKCMYRFHDQTTGQRQMANK
jgi:hypothetical protein